MAEYRSILYEVKEHDAVVSLNGRTPQRLAPTLVEDMDDVPRGRRRTETRGSSSCGAKATSSRPATTWARRSRSDRQERPDEPACGRYKHG
jgi:hypothetical protein